MPILGPVKENLELKLKEGWTGWKVSIKELEDTIKAYKSDDLDEVVFAVKTKEYQNRRPEKGFLYILGPTKVEAEEITPEAPQSQDEPMILASTSPGNPGEFDQFPPWP